MRLDVSAVLIWYHRLEFSWSCWSSVCIGNLEKLVLVSVKESCRSINRKMSLARKHEGQRCPSFKSFSLTGHRKVLSTFKVDLPTLTNPIKRGPHRCAQ